MFGAGQLVMGSEVPKAATTKLALQSQTVNGVGSPQAEIC